MIEAKPHLKLPSLGSSSYTLESIVPRCLCQKNQAHGLTCDVEERRDRDEEHAGKRQGQSVQQKRRHFQRDTADQTTQTNLPSQIDASASWRTMTAPGVGGGSGRQRAACLTT
jgi:hypothetical protein